MKYTSLLIFAIALASCLAFAQQTSSTIFEVGNITVDASGGSTMTNPEEYVLSRIFARKGMFINAGELARDQRTLIDSGVFSDVQILTQPSAAPKSTAMDLVYRVVVAPRFRAPATIKGNVKFSERKVRRLLDLAAGDRIDSARLNAKCDKIREEYRKKYYYDVKITATISETDSDGFASVTLEILEGERAKIKGFLYTGNDNIKASELDSILDKPSWYNPFPFFYSGWRQHALDFEHVRDTIITHYRNAGFLDVTVDDPVITEDENGRHFLSVKINEGPRYSVDSISVTGVTLFPEAELLRIPEDVLNYADNDRIASAKSLADATKYIREYFTSRGYADTTVKLKLNPTDKKAQGSNTRLVNAEFAVSESDLAHIRSVSIRGNNRTRDKVIRRELLVTPGMIMNEVLAERSKYKIENLGFFENVRYHEIPSRDDPLQRDVYYEVNEKSTGNLMVGIGTSSIDDIMGYLEISQGNFDIANWPTFRGGGQKAKLSVELGSNSNSGEISWTDPWFLDRKQSFTVELYRREISYSEYDETRIGGGVSLTVPFKYGRGSIRIGAEQVSTDDILGGKYTLFEDPTKEFAYTDLDDEYLRVPIRLSWTYDTRDRPFVPRTGTRNNIFGEITSSSLGSDYDTYRFGCDLRQYINPWWENVLSLRFRAESVDTFGSTDEVPINDRLFLGGGRSIRGYKYRNVGPKAIPSEETGGRAHPVGGLSMAMFSAEYAVPIAGPVRLAAFFDIGNVWSEAFDFDLGEYASSWGLGIRFDIPGFPIRLDYAFPLESDDEYTRKEHFIFWIGID